MNAMWAIFIVLINLQGTTIAEVGYKDYTYATKEECVDAKNDLSISWRSNLADIVVSECKQTQSAS